MSPYLTRRATEINGGADGEREHHGISFNKIRGRTISWRGTGYYRAGFEEPGQGKFYGFFEVW
jgi:hypothetical protein